MSDLFVALAFLLLVAGVVGSLVPSAPGALLSIAGVLVYWWQSGYSDPGALVLVLVLGVGVLAVAVDWLAGFLSAKVGGASTGTAVLAGLVGLALLFVFGPLGVLAGVTATVFVIEFYRNRDPRESAETALVTSAAMLGTNGVQALLTASMLVAMVWVAV